MDLFRFQPITGPILLTQGKIIGNTKSIMWVERYRDAGEFIIKARLDSGVREELPIGTLISHVDSTDVMIVENHEISDAESPDLEVVISGRSFETFLENRIVGSNQNWPNAAPYPELVVPSNYTWVQIVSLIEQQITTLHAIDDNDALLNVTILHNVVGTGETFARVLKRTDLYSVVLELLDIEKLGIKTIRPGNWSPQTPNLVLQIHKGVDRTKEVIFSHDSGDIQNADYLWSNKNLKNAALVTGRWVEVIVKGPETGYNRRMLFVDASDIDNSFSNAPVGADLTNVRNAMTVRGNQEISAHNELVISKAQAKGNLKKYVFRQDFDVGDLVTIDGEFDDKTVKRVIEYVEIEDENGESGYPTLSES